MENTTKLVYIVTEGHYSDYRVVAIFDNKQDADKLAIHISRGAVEEFTLNQYSPDISAGRYLFYVKMNRNGQVVEIKGDLDFMEPGLSSGYVGKEFTTRFGIEGSFFGKDEQHAIKVANEYRLKMIAENRL